MKIVRHKGAGGNVVWKTDKGLYYWNGPGARLYLAFGDVTSPSLVTVDHPSANGSYKTAAAAEAALRRFLRVAHGMRRRGRR